MKKIAIRSLLVLLTLFCISHTFSQEKILLQDNFTNNDFEWATVNHDRAYLNIEYGKYVFEHKRKESSWATWTSEVIDQSKDFKIQVTLKYIRGGEGHGFGVLWGATDLDNYFTFNFSKHGYFRFGKEESNNWTNIIEWTLNDAIRKESQTNTMTILKRGNQYYFYANDVMLQSAYFVPFFGDRIGFIVWNDQRIEFDSILITSGTPLEDVKDQINITGTLRITKYKSAVVEFSELGNLGIPDAGKIVSDWLSTSLNKTNVFDVYERISLQKLIDEQQFQISGLVDEKTMAEIGKVHGVEAILTGNISKFGQLYSVNVKLIDVQNAKVIDSSNRTTKKMDEIPTLIDKIAWDLATE
ncbi:CsgG/HfaB family protein [bacterium]